MSIPLSEVGLLIRGSDETLFFVPLYRLMAEFRLPDDAQKGTQGGDAVLAALDRCPAVHGLRNAILGEAIDLTDVAAGGPSGGKQKFSTAFLDDLAVAGPSGGKQKFSTGGASR